VEALCILLCQKFPHPRREVNAGTGRPVYTSRWKCILSEYNSVRARLLNSQALLEGTNLVLYTVNETTLLHWYKNSVRRDEIKLLMQGLSLLVCPSRAFQIVCDWIVHCWSFWVIRTRDSKITHHSMEAQARQTGGKGRKGQEGLYLSSV